MQSTQVRDDVPKDDHPRWRTTLTTILEEHDNKYNGNTILLGTLHIFRQIRADKELGAYSYCTLSLHGRGFRLPPNSIQTGLTIFS